MTDKIQKVLSVRTRPQRPNGLRSSMTIGWRALLKIKYVPEQLLDVTAFPIMFLLMFTYLFGGAIAGSTSEYLQFLLPGILVMTVVQITMYTGVELNNDISKGIFDRFRSLPIWRPSILVGMLLVDSVRYTLASAVMISLGLIMGFRPEGGALGVVATVALLILFSFSLSWIWTTLGLILRSEKSLMGVSMLVMFPLTFISNVFVDPRTLPSWLQAFVDVNPISLLVTASRGLMHGTATFEQIGWVIIASVIIMAIFAPITMYLYKNKK
ncbi:ABC transporter [Anaerobacillus alkalidiazotrophicus]|uniref:Transport permease protein n=1 Tax=Anaerobacillus alkalidiazotrophicus TaxID=472963 RepID=A0A1S2M224_9BACI|nr:ABC transporter permease [Anaerobacillus alkalidiazotrophicus]OIJ18560.1 ABC transporter [Anaerobacillus alkalidiazotrophicus]OIJ20005.1 ABC transporter [Anaerobacillus alkalidiazotrophicus]